MSDKPASLRCTWLRASPSRSLNCERSSKSGGGVRDDADNAKADEVKTVRKALVGDQGVQGEEGRCCRVAPCLPACMRLRSVREVTLIVNRNKR